jgi:predicted enzyme related to lactoylglutathione lyase/predicted kinase
VGVRQLRLVVAAEDYKEAVAFYRDALGLVEREAIAGPGGAHVTILDAGRATLEIADPTYAAYIDEVEVGRRVAGHVRVGFEVLDPQAVTAALESAGAAVVAAPVRTPWGSLNARLDGPGGLHLTVFSPEGEEEVPARPDDLVPRPGVYVVVSGPPASGKSTLAAGLARRLGLPLLAKDTVKAALVAALDVPDVAASRVVGRAAADAVLAVAAQSGGAVLEGPWHRSRATPGIAALPGRIVEVVCRVDRETAARRHRDRGDRGPGHFDQDRTDEELWNPEVGEPLAGGWPVLEVDATQAVDLDRLARRVRQAAPPRETGPSSAEA